MRTRARIETNTILWIFVAVTQIGLSIERLRNHSAHRSAAWTSFDSIGLVLWAGILILYSMQPIFNYWQVDSDAIRHRWLWKIRTIPFSSIVAIRPQETPSAKPTGAVEIEIARRAHDVYPHQYVTAKPAHLEPFLQAIRAQAPELLEA
jgi:hypothetical protein